MIKNKAPAELTAVQETGEGPIPTTRNWSLSSPNSTFLVFAFEELATVSSLRDKARAQTTYQSWVAHK